MKSAELVVDLGALGTLTVALCILLRGRLASRAPLLVVVLGVAVLRYLVSDPSFVHANNHGIALLENPWHAPFRTFRGYGPVAGLVHGVAMHLFGADLSVVACVDVVCATLALLPMAAVARRWFPLPFADLAVVSAAALHPVLLRLANSEDGHQVGLLFAWTAIWALDVYAVERRRAALVAGFAALVLEASTRQIFLAWIPLTLALAASRSTVSLRRDRELLASVAALGAFLVLRLANIFSLGVQRGHIKSIALRLSDPVILGKALAAHPLLAVTRFSVAFLPLCIWGAVVAWRSGRTGRVYVLGTVYVFASTMWLFEGQTVSFMFRVPVLMMAAVLVGLGTSQLLQALAAGRAPGPRRIASGAILSCLGAMPALHPGWSVVTELQPCTREYRVVQRLLGRLPRRFFMLLPHEPQPAPSYGWPLHLMADAGLEVREISLERLERERPDGPVLLLSGVWCNAYSLFETSGLPYPKSPAEILALRPHFRTFGLASIEGRLPKGYVVPDQSRLFCRAALRGAKAVTPPVSISARPDDLPFAAYRGDRIQVQFFELAPATLRELGRLSDLSHDRRGAPPASTTASPRG